MPLTESVNLVLKNGFTWNETVWNPSMISTALWLDAADSTTLFTTDTGSTLAANSGSVGRWVDKSNSARSGTQTTSNMRPLYQASAINGKGALLFDGSDDFMALPAPILQATHSLYIVFVPTIESVAGRLIGQFAASQTGRFAITTNFNSAGSVESGKLNLAWQGASMSDATITNAATIFGSVATTGAGGWISYINGTQASSATGPATLYQGVNTGIGADSASGAGSKYDGQIGEIIVLNAASTLGERQKFEGYLAHKWGLTANLPSDHPYKTVGPTP